MSEQDYSAWCTTHFALMREGGVWAVPRSGLVFRKTSTHPPVLELDEVMPHDPAMPLTDDELREYQRDDFAVIRKEFAKAGIEVVDRQEGRMNPG